MNARLKEVRFFYGLTQEQFAERIGVTRGGIAKIEVGDRPLTQQMIKSVCREFKVNYFWLRDGIGDMLEAPPETLLDEIVDEFELDELDRSIVESYLKLDSNKRTIIKDYLKAAFKLKIDE